MRLLTISLFLLLAACNNQQTASVPAPVNMTLEAVGHYCQMDVLEHEGPKAQVHLAGNANPLWFVQIRDALAYNRMPEQSAKTTVIYVNDMGRSDASWQSPGDGNWINAETAFYVSGSLRIGGMGVADFIPFADIAAAERFTKDFGGLIRPYREITDEEVLAPVDVDLTPLARADIEQTPATFQETQ
jgi:copper chaperone NosL